MKTLYYKVQVTRQAFLEAEQKQVFTIKIEQDNLSSISPDSKACLEARMLMRSIVNGNTNKFDHVGVYHTEILEIAET